MVSIVRDQKVFFGGYDLSGDGNSVSLNPEAETKDATTFGDNTRKHVAGLKSIAFGLSGFWNEEPDEPLFASIGADGQLITTGPSGTAAGIVYFFKGLAGKYGYEGQIGEIFSFNLEAVGQSDLLRGIIAENKIDAPVSATGSGTARQLGAVASGKKVYAGLHVLSVEGTDAEIDLVIKSDATNAFSGSETQRLAFSTFDAVGSELIELAGPITDGWWKPYWTVSGSDVEIEFVLVIAIQ